MLYGLIRLFRASASSRRIPLRKKRYINGTSRSGQAIVLIALGMIAFLSFAVLAIDGGKYYDQRRTAQNASDVASLAGLYKYEHGGTANKDSDVWAAVMTAAQKNGIPDSDG